MNTTPATLMRAASCSLAGLLLSAGLGAAAQPARDWEDPVTLGFQRMLAHSPYAGPTAQGLETGFDPLQLTLAVAQRRQQAASAGIGAKDDPVAASFQQLLAPQASPTALPRDGTAAAARIKRRPSHAAPPPARQTAQPAR